jgi:predicted permease
LRPKDFRSEAESVLLFTMKPQHEIYTDDQKRRFAAALLEGVKQIRGVRSAALAENGPLSSRTSQTFVFLPGHDPLRADFDAVTPTFFDTIGLPIVAGRDFADQDRLGSPRVMIINRALQRILFPDENPVGRHLKIRRGEFAGDYEVIAIAADTRYYDLHKVVQPGAWVAMSQFAPYMPTLHVHVESQEREIVTAAIRREFSRLDQGVPVFNIRTLQDRMNDALSGERMIATLSGGFGLLALVLAIIGLYGIIAYSVSWRTREIGIRRALGANAVSVLWMISREAVWLVGIGTAAGFALTGAFSRIAVRYVALSAAWTSGDLGIVGPAMLLLILVAVAVPSMRALRIDPLRALRHD